MNLAPLLEAPAPVQWHLATVLPAFGIGAWLIAASRKGGRAHRALGYVYLTLVAATALDVLFVHTLMPRAPLGFSPVHLLVPLTLFGLASAWLSARRHDVRGHRSAMLWVFAGGMLIAGGFTLVPGRILHAVLFGG